MNRSKVLTRLIALATGLFFCALLMSEVSESKVHDRRKIAPLSPGRVVLSAPRGSVQQAGLVLKKLDPIDPPSYPNEFFMPPPAPGEKGGRERLTDDVARCVRVMSDPVATNGVWCESIDNILVLATGTSAYFDISQGSNPALEDFEKDWLRVKQLAGCP